MGRSGVGKSVSLKLLLGFLAAGCGANHRGGRGRDRLERGPIFGDSAARDDGVSVGRAFRFAYGGRKCGVSRWRAATGTGIRTRLTRACAGIARRCSKFREFADRLPSDLSTGTKRAVAIARALAEDPDAILYDEPTTMVDPLMAAHISELILKLKRNAAQDLHRGDARHAPGEEAGRPRDLSAGRPRRIFRHLAELEASHDPFLRNFLARG